MNFALKYLLPTLVLLATRSPLFAFTIVIDPGHGGADHGATQHSIVESKIALQVALRLEAKFANQKDIKILFTRNGDSSISLKQRVKIAQQSQADLFISLHGNSSSDKRARGAEFYFGGPYPSNATSKNTPALETIVSGLTYNARLYQSQYLASDTFKIWKDSTASHPRAIKQAPFYVINKNTVPSILVEFGFITNSKEALDLLKDETQDLIAENIHTAIETYRKKNSYKPSKDKNSEILTREN